ncbi:MAG: ABC transporter permease [Actinobacteria bacterium]|nr:MAG: ABC transporter permease [Actinomycetota bacterium]
MATTDPTLATAPQLQDLTVGEVAGRSPWQIFWSRLRKDRAALLGGIIIVLFILMAVLAPIISHNIIHHGPNDLFQDQMTNELGLPKGPTGQFWFGADSNGRDVFVRTLYGLRTSLVVAIGATGVAVALGSVLGLIAGFVGGWVDILISRAVEILLSLPLLLFAIGLAAACSYSNAGCIGGFIKPGLGLILFIIAVFSWPYIARIIRGQTLSLREREFVDASRSLGASNRRIMFREVLPNMIAPIIIYSTLIIPSNILFEAYLSYLGVGLPQTTPSLGRLISDGANLYEKAWWLLLFPGVILFLATLAFNLLGDGLRDALDPRG